VDTVRSLGVALDQTAPAVSDEAALVVELKAGSEEAFAYLLAIYQNPLFNLISHMVADQGEAADVLRMSSSKFSGVSANLAGEAA